MQPALSPSPGAQAGSTVHRDSNSTLAAGSKSFQVRLDLSLSSANKKLCGLGQFPVLSEPLSTTTKFFGKIKHNNTCKKPRRVTKLPLKQPEIGGEGRNLHREGTVVLQSYTVYTYAPYCMGAFRYTQISLSLSAVLDLGSSFHAETLCAYTHIHIASLNPQLSFYFKNSLRRRLVTYIISICSDVCCITDLKLSHDLWIHSHTLETHGQTHIVSVNTPELPHDLGSVSLTYTLFLYIQNTDFTCCSIYLGLL